MKTTPGFASPTAFPRLLAACFLLGIFLLGTARANDRFFVPVAPPPPPPPSSPPSGGGSSDSGGSSNSGSSNSGSSNSGGSGRFFVPVEPPNSPSPSGPVSHGGGRGGGHIGWWDPYPYWGGCFYWDGCYYYWDGYYSHYWHRFDRYGPSHPYFRDDLRRHDHVVDGNGLLVFFPPEPPPLGSPLPAARPATGRRFEAPADLAQYIGAPFYAPLSTRMVRRNLSAKQLHSLEEYRSAGAVLVDELRAKITAVQGLAFEERQRELQAFAAVQAPGIAELDELAESLRTGLLRTGLVGSLNGTGNWNENRRWRLGKERLRDREKALPMEFRVMRAAVFYQDGLSPEQRRLLQELVMDLQVEAFLPASTRSQTESERPPMFFSPHTARLRFSEDLPGHITTKLAAYEKEKDALKEELRDLLYEKDASPEKDRIAALKRLADWQAPRLASLEVLAEEIRLDIAHWGRPVRQAPLPELPSDLAGMVAAYRNERAALQQALESKLAQMKKDPRLSSMSARDVATSAPGRELITEFNQQYEKRFAALDESRKQLCADLGKFLTTHDYPASSRSVEELMKTYERVREGDATWSLYDDYQNALFMPGLSPAQRRLLFDAGVRKLALPLPDGENIP